MSDEDDVLLNLLTEALESSDDSPAEELPTNLLAFAKGVHRLQLFESEFAEIARDSLVEAEATRSSDTQRTIEFSSPNVTVTLEVSDHGVLGSVDADGVVSVDIEREDEVLKLEVNDLAFFRFETDPRPFRLLVVLESGQHVRTDWLRLA